MWAVRAWNLSRLRSPFKHCSCFRLALAVRQWTSVSLHFQPCRCLYTFSIPQSLCISAFCFCASHFSFFWLPPTDFLFWLCVYPSFWPHPCYSHAWRESINHSVQIKSQIIIIENNGFHVSFSSALNFSHTYLKTRGLEARKSNSACALLGWNSSYPWSNVDWISMAVKLLSEFEHLSCKKVTMACEFGVFCLFFSPKNNRLCFLKSKRSSQEKINTTF